jgi:succinoglycan biosynthesis protein ExoA
MTVLIVIPTLNEAAHIGRLLHELLPFATACPAQIVVADGGSADGTQPIVREIAARQVQIHLLDNPDRLQSAGVNRAVQAFGADCDWLIRIDAHASYPAEYCQTLLDEASLTKADSVVVAMDALGLMPLQATIATAQNSRLGNGGSAHRMGGQGRWVDHGHHALIRMAAFRAVGGYDAGFSHNEDAELDHRLHAAGYRIWLTAATRLVYYPRTTLSGLVRQYFRFGKGRARNLIKHQTRPALRQSIVALLLPAQLLAVLAIWSPIFLLPLALWVTGCLAGGLMIGLGQTPDMAALSLPQRLARGLGAGFVAGTMHLAWSAGFWAQVLGQRTTQRGRADA